MKVPQLHLRDLFWLVLVVAVGAGWWIEAIRHQRAQNTLRDQREEAINDARSLAHFGLAYGGMGRDYGGVQSWRVLELLDKYDPQGSKPVDLYGGDRTIQKYAQDTKTARESKARPTVNEKCPQCETSLALDGGGRLTRTICVMEGQAHVCYQLTATCPACERRFCKLINREQSPENTAWMAVEPDNE